MFLSFSVLQVQSPWELIYYKADLVNRPLQTSPSKVVILGGVKPKENY